MTPRVTPTHVTVMAKPQRGYLDAVLTNESKLI